jgi:hypothetical protein
MTLIQYKGGVYNGSVKSVKKKGGKKLKATKAIKQMIPHGRGTFTFHNEIKYVGEFKNGVEHGYGTMTWSDGTTFSGSFQHGRPEAKLLKAFHECYALKDKVLVQQDLINDCLDDLDLEKEKSMAIALCLDKSQERLEMLYNLARCHGANVTELNAIRFG